MKLRYPGLLDDARAIAKSMKCRLTLSLSIWKVKSMWLVLEKIVIEDEWMLCLTRVICARGSFFLYGSSSKLLARTLKALLFLYDNERRE